VQSWYFKKLATAEALQDSPDRHASRSERTNNLFV
jgi:hypothetical protein